MSRFPKTSSFQQEAERQRQHEEGPRVESVTPHIVHEAKTSVRAPEGPSREQLDRWYNTLDGYLAEVGDRGLEDVRDELYTYLY